jgi:hypothetical protein
MRKKRANARALLQWSEQLTIWLVSKLISFIYCDDEDVGDKDDGGCE